MSNDWRESSEGDLDPDLTEEVGYSGWDPPRRHGWQLLYRIVLAVLLIVLVGSFLAVFVR